jgi:hypothetical protein
MAGSTRKRRPKGASKLSSADDDGLTDDDLADERDAPESSAAGDGSSTDTVVVSEGEAPAARKARLEAEISRTRARLDALVAAVETIELEQLPAGRRSGGRLATVDAAEEVSLTLDKVPPAAGASDAGVPFWRTRLWWAKFWVVATGIWWGVCMQLLYYEGASSPASALPNVDWYLGMMLVYLPQLCRQYGGGAADERFGKVRQRDMVPIALFDLLGTVRWASRRRLRRLQIATTPTATTPVTAAAAPPRHRHSYCHRHRATTTTTDVPPPCHRRAGGHDGRPRAGGLGHLRDHPRLDHRVDRTPAGRSGRLPCSRSAPPPQLRSSPWAQ